MTGPDCAVMCNVMNTRTRAQTVHSKQQYLRSTSRKLEVLVVFYWGGMFVCTSVAIRYARVVWIGRVSLPTLLEVT